MENNDWRLQGQEEYLQDKVLYYKKYHKHSKEWDHEHCDFCGAKISEYSDDLHEGYCTENEEYWICEECYNDFKEMFNWKIDEKK